MSEKHLAMLLLLGIGLMIMGVFWCIDYRDEIKTWLTVLGDKLFYLGPILLMVSPFWAIFWIGTHQTYLNKHVVAPMVSMYCKLDNSLGLNDPDSKCLSHKSVDNSGHSLVD